MCDARLATGPLPKGIGSGVPVRVCGRGHANDVYMGMGMPSTPSSGRPQYDNEGVLPPPTQPSTPLPTLCSRPGGFFGMGLWSHHHRASHGHNLHVHMHGILYVHVHVHMHGILHVHVHVPSASMGIIFDHPLRRYMHI